MKFIKDGLSVDETKISTILLTFVITLGFGLYKVISSGDIPENLLALLGYQIVAITGINVADKFTGKNKKEDQVIGE
jgi:purine-cytosine permease-like protein